MAGAFSIVYLIAGGTFYIKEILPFLYGYKVKNSMFFRRNFGTTYNIILFYS